MNSFGARLSSFGGSRNIPPAVRAAAVASGASPYEIVSLDFANQQYWRKGVRSSLAAVPGITFGANAPNLTADGLLIEDADDATTLTDLDALGLTPAVLAAGYTVVVDILKTLEAGNPYSQALSLDGGSLAERFSVAHGGGGNNLRAESLTASGDSGAIIGGSLGGLTSGALTRLAVTLTPAGLSVSRDGGAPIVDDTVDMPSPTLMRIGARSGISGPPESYWNGIIALVLAIPRPITGSPQQALSAL
jgi:hypothetical protein